MLTSSTPLSSPLPLAEVTCSRRVPLIRDGMSTWVGERNQGIMALVYEVWDTLTANRIGAFSTRAEAESLLRDVLRVNGPAAAEDMVVLASDSDSDEEPELIVDGVTLAARS